MNAAIAALFGSAGEDKIYVEDVFSAYTYTGNGTTQTITNDIDLATYGGLVWIKDRGDTRPNVLTDSVRGVDKYLISSITNAQQPWNADAPAFNTSGFSVPVNSGVPYTNYLTHSYASWTYRNAPKFFAHTQVIKSAGSNATVDLSTLGTVGMVAVKRIDSTGDWYVWQRSLTAGKLLYLNKTDAEATLGHITVSGTTLTLVNGVIADGTYIVYAWAHDASAEGIIQCGSFTTDGSGNGSISHGWSEGAQFAMLKCSSATGDCEIFDTARTSEWSGSDARLRANLSNAEDSVARLSASSGALSLAGLSANATYMYAIIRSEAA